ncbi:MAG: hypothetical protein IIB09_01705, partial [Bacteroidetes bacterium]|nr:hypothetical protein [Bacteroidota bacterium]
MVKGAEDDSWDAYKLAIGLNEDTALSQIRVPVEGELAIIMRRLKAEAKQAIDPEDATALFRLQPEAFSDGSVDLWQLQRYLGSLKRRLRLASAGKVATDPSGRDIERVMVSVQKQRDAFLKKNHPEILEQVLHAEELTLARAT